MAGKPRQEPRHNPKPENDRPLKQADIYAVEKGPVKFIDRTGDYPVIWRTTK